MYDLSLGQAKALANIDAEQGLLGALMYSPQEFNDCEPNLRGEHFFEPAHGAVFDNVRIRIGAGKSVDGVMIAEDLQDHAGIKDLGGLRYIALLVEKAPYGRVCGEYSRVILDLAQRRRLISTALAAAAEAERETTTPAFELAGRMRLAAEAIEADAATDDNDTFTAEEAGAMAIERMGERVATGRARGLKCGLYCVDHRLGGLKPGKLIVIGARPSMGKTAFARAILSGAAERNPECLFVHFGVEMDPEEMSQRELSARSWQLGDGIPYQNMADDRVTPMDLISLDAIRLPRNLLFVDCPRLSVADVRRKVWALSRTRKIGAVAIDYLQIMEKPDADGRNDAAVIGQMTAELKQLSRRREGPFAMLLLSQLSRALEARDDKRPVLNDLRESGAIEQDADAVLFPYRPYYYIANKEPKEANKIAAWETECEATKRLMEVICSKQRQGPVGTDRQTFFAEYDHIQNTGQ